MDERQETNDWAKFAESTRTKRTAAIKTTVEESAKREPTSIESAQTARFDGDDVLPARPDALYISPGDPWSGPRGGQTAFARQVFNAFGDRFAIVAPDETNETPVGRWIVGDWNGVPVWRFNVGSYAPRNKGRAPLIPRRIVYWNIMRRRLPAIRRLPIRNLFCDELEILRLLAKYDWDSVCFCFPGLDNPVAVSRYAPLRAFAGAFRRFAFSGLAKLGPETILAAADERTIIDFQRENKRLLEGKNLVSFPTRFDPAVFYPGDAKEIASTRRELGLADRFPRLVVVGRLCWIKGWELALDAAKALKSDYPNLLLTFVGNGEDRAKVEERIERLGLRENAQITGFLPPIGLRRRLIAADLVLVASQREGWSVAMTEALACGKTLVSTDVSGARSMIDDGVNGKIVKTRSPKAFADAVRTALTFPLDRNDASLKIAERFSLATLKSELESVWPVFTSRTADYRGKTDDQRNLGKERNLETRARLEKMRR